MHANLNKTASKTLLLLLPKDEEGKARKPRTFLHNLLKIRGAQTMAAVRNGIEWVGRMAKEHAERQNCMKCVSILPCTVHTAAPLPRCPLAARMPACLSKALSFGLCAFIFHLHEFFIVFPDAKRKRSELHFTLRRISTNTRYLSVGNQLENQLATQTKAVPHYPSPKAPLSACSVILSHRDIHNVTVPSSAMYPKSVCFG